MDDTLRSAGRELALLRRLARTHGIGAWALDLDGLRLHWTDEVFRIHDLDASTHVPTLDGALEFIAPEGRAALAAAVKAAIETATGWDLELPLVSARGARRWVRSIGEAELRDGRCIGLSGTLQDITDARRARDALHARSAENRRLATVAESTTSAVIIADAANRIEWVNASFTRITGYRLAEAAGQCPCELLTGSVEVGQQLFAQCRQRIERGEAVSGVQLQLRRRDGRPYWVEVELRAVRDEAGALIHFVHIHTDITERRLAAQRVEALTQRLRLATESAGLGVFERDAATGQGSYDECARRLLGLPAAAESVSLPDLLARIHGEDRDRYEQYWARVRTTAAPASIEYRAADACGRTVHLLERSAPRRADTATQVLGIVVDVTAQREARDRAQTATEWLRVAVSATGIGLYHKDLDAADPEWDAQTRRILGLPESAPVPAEDEREAMVLEEDRATYRAALRAAQDERTPLEVEFRWRRPDGDLRWIRLRRAVLPPERGRPARIVGAVLDVTDLKHHQAQQRRLGEQLALAVDATGMGVWEMRLPDDEVHWSDRMLALHGLPAGSPAPTRLQWRERFLHPDDRGAVERAAARFIAGDGPYLQEYRIRRADGELRWLQTRAVRVNDGDRARPARIVGVSIDVTDRREAEARLHDALDRLSLATDGAEVGIYVRDMRSGRRYWNEQCFRLFGLPPAPTPPAHEQIVAAIHPDDRDRYLRALREPRRPGQTRTLQLRVGAPDGPARWLMIRAATFDLADDGTELRRAGVVVDITAQKQTELELHAKNQWLHLASATFGIGFWSSSIATGDLVWDHQLRRIFGLAEDADTPTPERLIAAVLPQDRQRLLDLWDEIPAPGERIEVSYRIRRADGQIRHLLSRRCAEYDGSGTAVRLYGAVLDVTELRQTTEALRRAVERLELITSGSDIGHFERRLDGAPAHWSEHMFALYRRPLAAGPPGWDELLTLVHPEDRADFVDSWQRLVAGSEREECEYRILRGDGSQGRLLSRMRRDRGDDGAARVIGVAIDVTQRRLAEEQAASTAQMLQLATHSVGIGFAFRDLATGVGHWDERARLLFGFPRDGDAPSIDAFLARVVPEDRPRVARQYERPSPPGTLEHIEYDIRLPSGEVRRILSRRAAQHDGEGRPYRLHAALVDVTDARRAEQALDETRERLRLAAETGGIASWERDLTSGAARWDEGLFRIFQLDPAAGPPSFDVLAAMVHPDDASVFLAAWRELRESTRSVEWENRYCRADGSVVHVVTRARCHWRDGAPWRVIGVTIDVTASRLAALRLREALQRLKLATETSGIGVWERDLRSGAGHWDATMFRLYGLDGAQPTPTRAEILLLAVEEDRPLLADAWKKLDDSDAPVEVEFRIRRPAGDVAYLSARGVLERDARGTPLRVVGTTIDVTASRVAQQRLREFAEWLQIAGAATGIGFFHHAADGTSTFNDRQMLRIYGFDPHGPARTSDEYLQRLLPQDRPILIAARARALQVDEPVEAEYRIHHPERGTRTILTRRVRQCDAAGQATGVIGAALDVTESRTATEALRATERELRDALERMRMASAAAGLGTWERDLVSGAACWDEPMFRLYGLPPSAHPPSREQIYAMMTEAEAAAAHRTWMHAIATGAPLDVEAAITTPAGERRVLYSRGTVVRGADGQPQRVFGITLDMTARRQTETELRRAKEQLELAAQASNLGIWCWELADGALTVDPRVRGLLGVPEGRALDARARLQSVHPDDLPRVQAAYEACIAGTNAQGQCEYRIVRPDGETRHVYENFVVEHDAGGHPLRLVGTNLDVTGVRRAQRERDALAERLQQVAAAVGLGVWEWDPQAHRSVWNDQMYELLGRSREWFADHVWTDVMAPEDAAEARSVLQRAIEAGGPFEHEFRVLLPDGRVRWLASRGRAERSGGQVRVFGVNYDITDRRGAEERLRELAERLQMATSATGIAVWFIRTDSGAMLADDLLAELHGIAPQPPKRLWAALEATIVPEDLAGLKQASIRARESRAPFAYEYRTRHPDGRVRHLAVQGRHVFDEHGAVTRMMGVTFDVTDRKRAEQELREAEARARELLERMQLTTSAAEMGLWEVHLETGEVLWDDLMYRLYGRSPEAAPDLPQRWTETVHPDDRERVRAAIAAAIGAGSPLDLTFRIELADGTVRHVAHRGRLRRAADGRPLRLYGVTWDVTERQRAEAALRAKEAAERASHAKTEFLSRMSHELRTPLNAILGFAQVLELDPSQPLSPVQAERVGQIGRAGWHLLTLINEILDLSRIEAGALKLTMSSVPVAAVIDECMTLIQTDAARRRLQVTQMQQPTAPTAVWADTTRLKQVLLNLLSNAVKYNREGGRIVVSHEADPAGNAVIAVRDTGAGLTPAQIERLFEPFNRLGQEDTAIEGTGIGLTIARRLVEQMGGQLDVRSAPAEGSEFRVTLPAATAEPAAAVDVLGAVGIGLHESRAEVRGNVLYVEDNESNVEVVRQLLALRPNVRLHVAGDGASARVLAAVCQPDLILLDMRLPDTDGHALLRELQRQPATAGIACVGLSANALPTDVAQARAAGFADYWTKPLDATQFLRGLDLLLAQPHMR